MVWKMFFKKEHKTKQNKTQLAFQILLISLFGSFIWIDYDCLSGAELFSHLLILWVLWPQN